MDDKNLHFTTNLQRAREIGTRAAAEYETNYVGSEHIFYGILSMPGCAAAKILSMEGVDFDRYKPVFLRTLDPDASGNGLTTRTKEMFRHAVEYAESIEHGAKAGTVHFLYAALENRNCVAVSILESLGADVETLIKLARSRMTTDGSKEEDARVAFGAEKRSEREKAQEKVELKPFSASVNDGEKKETKGKEKAFEFGEDLTARAKKGKLDPVIGREKEIEEVVQVLSRRTKNNPVLTGEAGVGKSAIAEGLAQLIVSGNVPEQLYNKTVFSVDIAGMVAGAKYRGDFEERLKNLIDAVQADGDVVLFIDEIHTIVGAGSSSENSMDAANILKPMLARGDLQVIGATTIEEYRKHIEKDPALARRFTPVYVEEPSAEKAVEIIKGLRPKYEQHHGICISDEAIETAVKLSVRYITDRYLPDKAIDLIDEAAASARISHGDDGEMKELEKRLGEAEARRKIHESKKEYAEATKALGEVKDIKEKLDTLKRAGTMEKDALGRSVLGKEQVAAIVSRRVNIPLLKITQGESEKLLRLEDELHARIIGQNEAVSAVSKAIRRSRAGLKDPSRPIGSFIFVGPTGVGKTDLCKALAETMFGSEDQLIRLDMSEYMEKQSVSKLIGAAPGYVGYDDLSSGQLTEKIRTKPYSVILFDEIEKAHPDIFNLLLQVLDDGRLTDNKGRTVSFKNAVIILTSNVGAEKAAEKETGVYGFGGSLSGESADDGRAYEEMKERITNALKEKFRPEFLNRFDEVVVFHNLTKEDAEKICEKMVASVAKRLLEQNGIELTLTHEAVSALTQKGYDYKYGARPLKRAIQREIEDRLSEEILSRRIVNGDKVVLDHKDGAFLVR